MSDNFKTLVAITFLTTLCSSGLQAQPFNRYEADIAGITYRIDWRIELFNSVAMLFGHNGMTQSNIPYKQQELEHFLPFQHHPVVDSLLHSYYYGWAIDDPILFMLCLDDHLNIMPGLDTGLIRRGGGLPRLKLLASLFKDFVQQSDFYQWFNTTQRPFYEEVISQTRYNLRNFRILPLLEQYYGEKQHSYTAVLNLTGAYGNFGHAFTREGKTDLYAVVETSASAGEVPVFAPTVSLFTLFVHEFSHGFVNPAVNPYISMVDRDSALYEPVRDAMRAAAYGNWRSTVIETIVPAVVIRMAQEYYGKAFAEQAFYRPEMGRRFIYLDTLLDRLAYYESHRQQYPTFRDFVKPLLSVFDHITPDYISHLQQKVARIREPDVEHMPRPTDIARDSTTWFIVGTHETDQKAQAIMQSWVTTYHQMISPQSPVITDDQAMGMNLAGHDIVLIGTPEGNGILHACISRLPVTILKDSILTNKIIKGDHLQFITAWVNPFDPRKTMVIYTAQRTADITNFQSSPYKEQYGYWVGENTVTLDKGEWVRYGKIWQCDPL